MKKYQKFPGEVNDFYNPGIELWWDFYGWLPKIDPKKVAVMIDSTFPPKQFGPGIQAVICTSFEVDPRIRDLENLANSRPDLPFIWLCDSDLYDYKLPKNIFHIRFRHFHLRQKQFMLNFEPGRIIKAKSKKFLHKFSSMSWWSRQNRALITAALLTYARDQSFLSWHGVQKTYNPTVDLITNNVTCTFDYQHHGKLIQTLIDHPLFKDLDWSFIDEDITFDSFDISNNFTEYNLGDVHHPGYENTAINFTNETTSFGFFSEGDISYIRPGPYLNEKTVKPLITGTICFNSGQPFLYKFLKERYELDCNYKLINLEFDNMDGDIDRYAATVENIRKLSTTSLADIVDANIDVLEQIQDTLLEPSWFDYIQKLNAKEEQEVLDLLAKLVQ